MKNFKCLLAIAAIALAPTAHAATASSFLDLSNLTIQKFGDISYEWLTPEYKYMSADIYSGDGWNSISSAGTLNFSGESAGASATTGPGGLKTSAYANPGFSTANSYYSSVLSVTGRGFLLISVPYTISVTARSTSDEFEEANTGLSFSIQSGSYEPEAALITGGESAATSAYMSNYSYHDLNLSSRGEGAESETGTLAGVFNHYGSGTDYAHLSFTTYASVDSNLAPVPEPETYAMLLAGLGLMGAVVRRRKQNQG